MTLIHHYRKIPQKQLSKFYNFYSPLKFEGLGSPPLSSTNPSCITKHYFIFL